MKKLFFFLLIIINHKQSFVYSQNLNLKGNVTFVIEGITEANADIRVEHPKIKKPILSSRSSVDGKFSLKFSIPRIFSRNINGQTVETNFQQIIIFISKLPKKDGMIVLDFPYSAARVVEINKYAINVDSVFLSQKDSSLRNPSKLMAEPTYLGDISWDYPKKDFVFYCRCGLNNQKNVSPSAVSNDTYAITGNLYFNSPAIPLTNAKVNLVNKEGKVVQSATTNSFGSYVFTNLIKGKDYTIIVISVPPKITITKIVMTSRDGKKIAVSENKKMFRYELLANDKNAISLLTVDGSKLLVDIKGKLFSDKEKQIPFANAKLILKNAKGEIIGVVVTNGKGFFQFMNLPADQNYLLEIDEKDASLLSKDVFLADANGRIIKTIKSKDGKYFHYEILSSEQNGLSTIYYDDPWLKIGNLLDKQKQDSLVIIENIFYDFQKWNLLPEAISTLDKAIEAMKQNPTVFIELISHTDSRGTNEFNMELSQKRASTAVDYIISKGVDKSRITGKGMGEEQLVNRCKDGVDCTEEEHSQNRRTEFRIKNISK